MTSTTVAELASELNKPTETLLEQLASAGVQKAKPTDVLSDADKQTLLSYLQTSHGTATNARKKITLVKKSTSEIKQADARGGARTIQVEVRKKRTFVRRDDEAVTAKPADIELERRVAAAEAEAESLRAEEAAIAEARAAREAEAARQAAADAAAAAEAAKAAADAAKAAEATKPQSAEDAAAAAVEQARLDREAARAAAMAEAAWSCVEKMLQLVQVTSAPSAVSVSISTAVWMVMCSEPVTRTPFSGAWAAYLLRIDISPGISASAMSISLRPQSARVMSAIL